MVDPRIQDSTDDEDAHAFMERLSEDTINDSMSSVETPAEPVPAVADIAEDTPVNAVSDALTEISSDRLLEAILSAHGSSISFLSLADLPRVKTAQALRGKGETQISDAIQLANSVLIILAHYGSERDDQALVDACEMQALKMKTIIKRLCL